MRISLLEGKCVGHARCAAVAPNIYALDDNGYLLLAERTIEPGHQPSALRGARACPERAIAVDQDEAPAA